MRKEKRQSYPGSQIGTSFLLVVFIILCLVIFATLSLSGALRDQEYSKKAAAKTTAYYAADTKAVHRLAEIDALLAEAQAEAKRAANGQIEKESYLEIVAEKLGSLDGVQLTTDEDGRTIVSYQVAIDEAQELQVALELTDNNSATDETRQSKPSPDNADAQAERLYKIIKWKEVSSSAWEEKTTLPVLGNGEIVEE